MERRLVSYLSTFRHNIDGRNRVTVPAQWRVPGDEGNYYMAWPHPNGYITFFTPDMQDELHEKARNIPQFDIEGQELLAHMFGSSFHLGCDKQGRILLPPDLIAHAGIQKEAVLVGMGRNFQIWAGERYSPPKRNILDTMKRLNI